MTSSEADRRRLDAALRYARAGYSVFPCGPGRKTPAVEHGLLEATTSDAQIRRWWERMPAANVALDCGRSGLAVVDLDPPTGLDVWRRLLAEHPDTPRTLTVQTPRGGFHLYYAADPGRHLRSTASELGAPRDDHGKRLALSHVDTRGIGGYVLAPPSTVGGIDYVVGRRPDGPTLPTIPGWVLDEMARQERAAVAVKPLELGHLDRYAAAAVDRETALIADAPEGTRNGQLNRSAFALGTLVGAGALGRTDAEEALTNAGRGVGLGALEVDKTIRSGLDAGVRRPRETRPREHSARSADPAHELTI